MNALRKMSAALAADEDWIGDADGSNIEAKLVQQVVDAPLK
jgi:hypothetical protein